MSTPKPEDLPRYTYADYVQWEGRWELIQGIAHAMSPAPGILHQSISQRIASQLERALENCRECQALLPVDWKIDEETTVQPDNLVVCGDIVDIAYLTKAPALIFEVLSKSTARKDRTTKFQLYEQEGVRYYVIVDPDEHIAKIHHLREGRYIQLMDASDEVVEFELGTCRTRFEFATIWPGRS
ncbi:hypothetical protein CKO27_21640 [Thiocystis violacea]|nr:hypothetical protein [Thiocystis violacea]